MNTITNFCLGVIFFVGIFMQNSAFGQDENAGPCNSLSVDFDKGTLNGLDGTVSMEKVKEALPCFTGDSEENEEGWNCGGGVFYLNHDFYFYTFRDYIEVRDKYPGEITKAVLGMDLNEANDLMGEPDDSFVYVDDLFGDETMYLQYAKKWGTLVVVIKEGKVWAVQMHRNRKIGEIDFCY